MCLLEYQTHLDEKWNRQCEQLMEFKRTNGHCMVPCRYEQDKYLARWVGRQRTFQKNNRLRLDRKERLDEIGFAWSVERFGLVQRNNESRESKWNMHYEKMVEFQRKNGHCIVPTSYEQDKSLGEWVKRQRRRHVTNKLLPDQKELLNALDFVWKAANIRKPKGNTFKELRAKTYLDKKWNRQCEQLLKFKRKNGHCMVPYRYEQDKYLAGWVAKQRYYHKNNKLGLDRKRVLDEIGFAWSVERLGLVQKTNESRESKWNMHYEKMVEFQRKNGHCIVRYEQDKTLGEWVKRQRKRYANNKLLPDQKELLDALDFVWKAAATVATRVRAPNRKRPSTSLVKSGGMATRTRNQRGKATVSSSPVEEDGGGRNEEDSKPYLMTSRAAQIGSHHPDQEEVVPEQATTLGEIPYGWSRVKLEPDC